MKRYLLTVPLASSLALPLTVPNASYAITENIHSVDTTVQVNRKGFTDVPSTHWAVPAIQWGASNKVIAGYPDKTFRPENQVDEAEFLSMLVNSYMGPQPQTDDYWASGSYALSKKMNWPTLGAENKSARTWKINRQRVAEIVSSAAGVNYSGDDAVKYLLGKGLAVGKNPNKISVDSFKPNDFLTRAEAVQFIKAAKEKGLTELKERPETPSDPAQIPPLPQPKPVPPVSKPAPTPVPQPSTNKVVLHEVKANDPGLSPAMKRILGMKLPASPETDSTVDAFLKSIRIENGVITGKIPTPPKGYTVFLNYGSGTIKMNPGTTFSKPTNQITSILFDVWKDDWEGVNYASVLPTGEYWRGTK